MLLKYADETYLTVVSVQALKFLDITHGGALGQRLSAQVRRRKGGQGVRCICRKTRWNLASEILASTYHHDDEGDVQEGVHFSLGPVPSEFEAFVDSRNPTGSCSYRCTADGVGSVQLQTAPGCCYNAESCHTGCQKYHPPSVKV